MQFRVWGWIGQVWFDETFQNVAEWKAEKKPIQAFG